ncbi:MAG: hypothetical protein GTO62_04830 [Planctomycetales bacterium]|nr:hypothetical protein [Planctomycetales bacterium]NIP68582.1 hypothetical protein [Planctomycetales bacterium]
MRTSKATVPSWQDRQAAETPWGLPATVMSMVGLKVLLYIVYDAAEVVRFHSGAPLLEPACGV